MLVLLDNSFVSALRCIVLYLLLEIGVDRRRKPAKFLLSFPTFFALKYVNMAVADNSTVVQLCHVQPAIQQTFIIVSK